VRIALAGKGGAGKTTTAATLARTFARLGYRVNALDDDPNPNLGVALGLSVDQLAVLKRVPREDILEERVDPDGHSALHLTRPFEDVLSEYGVRGPDDVGVLMMTGLLGAGKG
jgi:CO dehydrogenase maturation factor